MIGSLSGRLASKDIDEVVVDVQGVGYRVSIPLSTYESLPGEGEEVRLLTHLHVREDELALYGFASDRERQMPAKLRQQRDELELKVAALRAAKESMNEDEYYRRLEKLMLELARLYEKAGSAKPRDAR